MTPAGRQAGGGGPRARAGGFRRGKGEGEPPRAQAPDKPHLHVTVAFHKRDMQRGTLRAIVKQAGMTTDEFVALL